MTPVQKPPGQDLSISWSSTYGTNTRCGLGGLDAIDFTLNDNQRRLRREARQFGKMSYPRAVGTPISEPIERFVATRRSTTPSGGGLFTKCIPVRGGLCADW